MKKRFLSILFVAIVVSLAVGSAIASDNITQSTTIAPGAARPRGLSLLFLRGDTSVTMRSLEM